MAYTVEDGTGVADANSYVLVAEADLYFADRGVGTWATLNTAQKQAALVKATDYLDQRYGSRYVGVKYSATQSLEWPRLDSNFDTDEIPPKLKYACFEYALRASAAELAPDPLMDAAGVSMVTTRVAAGPVEQEFQPVGGYSASVKTLRPYPAADMYLRGLVVPGQGVIR